jgi:hypothetical protein
VGKECKLVIMDAAPLIKLAVIEQLDLLFSFGLRIHIPDEVLFEAIEKHAWMEDRPLTSDKLYLQAWVEKNKEAKRVVPEHTFIGASARRGREEGELSPENYPPNLGELAADSVYLKRAALEYENDPAVLMLDDYAATEMFKNKNAGVFIFTTFSFLLQLEKAKFISSADEVWDEIVVHLPTAGKMNEPDPSGAVRDGTTVSMRPR